MPDRPNPVQQDTIRSQLGAAYDRFDAAARSVHVRLLRDVRAADDLSMRADQAGEREWTVTVCVADRVGALSVMAGLFTAYRFSILNADIFTLTFETAEEEQPLVLRRGRPARPPRAPATPREPARRTLDIFEVRALAETDAETWETFRADLAALVETLSSGGAEAAREQLMDRVSEVARRTPEVDESLFPVAIELDADASPDAMLMRIRSADTVGFLFEFTNALALLGASIQRADIRTVGSEARDSFWLTDAAGRKITDQARLRDLRVAAALIKQFTHLLPNSPNPAQALRQFGALTGQMLARPDWTAELRDLESGSVLGTLAELMGVSRFLWEDFLRIQHDNLFPVLLDTPALEEPRSAQQLRDELRTRLDGVADHEQRVRALNDFKDRAMFAIDLRHITHRVDFVGFSREISDLAEVAVEATAEVARGALADRSVTPADGEGAAWCICALGKCGGREMGFASDVELIFVYQGADGAGGEGAGDASSAGLADYFEQFVREFMATLKVHRQGVFEVDLRLRPHGDAGALATSAEGFARYFGGGGDAQQFERMALVKLRPVAGDAALGARIEAARDAFVYSGEPLDMANIQYLRGRQASELVASGAVNAKYSPGGVTDIEYFVQAQQIQAGAGDQAVRVTGTLDAIQRLSERGHLEHSLASAMTEAYGFLRRLIDALRVVRGNARDLAIPTAGSREIAYLARRLDFETAAELERAITEQMAVGRGLWRGADAQAPAPRGVA